MLLAAVAP